MSVARALLADIRDDPQALEEAWQLIRPMVDSTTVGRVTYSADDWLDTRRAAEHLGMSVNALDKLTSSRTIPFHQDVRGGKCWFRRSESDDWRERG
jgi:hypothetical protein